MLLDETKKNLRVITQCLEGFQKTIEDTYSIESDRYDNLPVDEQIFGNQKFIHALENITSSLAETLGDFHTVIELLNSESEKEGEQ